MFSSLCRKLQKAMASWPGTVLILLLVFPQAMSFSADPPEKSLDTDSVQLKFWGKVAMNVHYDTDDIRGTTDFATYITGAGQEELNFNPRDTRVGFSATSHQENWQSGLVAEMDFYGDNAGNNLLPRLRLGYVTLQHKNGISLRLGQDWIPIGQQNPDTLDFGILAWGGNLWWRVPQVTVRGNKGHFQWLGSLMKHRISGSQEAQEDLPWVLGRVQWSANRNLLAFGVGARDVEVDQVNYSPWMGVLEFKSGMSPSLSLVGEFWAGAGIGREFIRYGLDYNLVLGEEIKGRGGFVSLSYIPTGQFRYALGYGQDQPDREDVFSSDGVPLAAVPFLKNQVFFANARWNLNQHTGFGVEVMDLDTLQTSGEGIHGQRFTFSGWYTF